jgi:hypothetical protein
MGSAQDRGQVYAKATQYYYTGSFDARAAIYNKVKGFINKLSGFLMQPTDVRFQIVFDSGEPDSVLQRAQLVGEKLTADFKVTDCDVIFSEAVTWSLVNGAHLLKITGAGPTFKINTVHPQNFGVLSETTLELEEQEAFCHVSYPTVSRLDSDLASIHHPKRNEIVERALEAVSKDRMEEEPSYLHQVVVGGLQPLGNVGDAPSAAGIVSVFPVPTPWRPQSRSFKWNQTVKHCELWVKDARREGDYTTLQFIYPDIIIEGHPTNRNLSRVPGKSPFVKIQAERTPGYFWGRSFIADIQMLQDVLNKRLRDIKVMWDRNTAAPYAMSGFTSLTEEQYFKLISEGGFIADPNPNAKAQKLVEPPPQGYLEELEFIWRMFDEAGGFSAIMSGQGEPGVRAGVHAQTLVRTSSPQMIDRASRLERQLADCGYIGLRIMQAEDAMLYTTDQGTEFTLIMLPPNFQVQVDSHSASPAFAEDNRQVAIALARAGAIDAEDLIHMLHPPGSELLLARLRQRQKAAAEAEQKKETRDTIISLLTGKPPAKGQAGRRPKR